MNNNILYNYMSNQLSNGLCYEILRKPYALQLLSLTSSTKSTNEMSIMTKHKTSSHITNQHKSNMEKSILYKTFIYVSFTSQRIFICVKELISIDKFKYCFSFCFDNIKALL